MKLRRAYALLLGPALAMAGLVPMATSAHAASGALAICAVAGTVQVTPGVGELPPGAPATGASYIFTNVALVCAGTVAGAATSVSDSGTFGPVCGGAPEPPILGQFCDTGYAANGFASGALNGNANCSGLVGGPMPKVITDAWAKISTQNPGATGTGWDPVSNPNGRWSLTAGALITGDTTMSCLGTGLTTAGHMTGGNGLIALVAEPDPLQTVVNVQAPVGQHVALGRDCPSTGPLTIGSVTAPPPNVWWCGIIVEGVSVVVG